jgi:hypothetical protein
MFEWLFGKKSKTVESVLDPYLKSVISNAGVTLSASQRKALDREVGLFALALPNVWVDPAILPPFATSAVFHALCSSSFKHLERGELQAALGGFLAAHKVLPWPSAMYGVALCQCNMNHYLDAFKTTAKLYPLAAGRRMILVEHFGLLAPIVETLFERSEYFGLASMDDLAPNLLGLLDVINKKLDSDQAA